MFIDEVEVLVELAHPDAQLPRYKNPGDAGMDVYAVEDTLIKAGETKVVKTGLKFVIPNGYELQVRPRSGLSLTTNLRIPNSPGTIDAGYRDELGIIIHNSTVVNNDVVSDSFNHEPGSYLIKKGDRIAQLVLATVPKALLTVVRSVAGYGEDRGGGFGSTGR